MLEIRSGKEKLLWFGTGRKIVWKSRVGRKRFLWFCAARKIFLKSEWEGKYFGFGAGRKIFLKSERKGKYFGFGVGGENIFEIRVRRKIFLNSELERKIFLKSEWEENIFGFEAGGENIFEIKVRRKIFWIQSWRGKYFGFRARRKVFWKLRMERKLSFTWRKSHTVSVRFRDVSKVSHVLWAVHILVTRSFQLNLQVGLICWFLTDEISKRNC